LLIGRLGGLRMAAGLGCDVLQQPDERLAGADADRVDGDAGEPIEPDVRRCHVGAGPSRLVRRS
jgi:hypothetical protein